MKYVNAAVLEVHILKCKENKFKKINDKNNPVLDIIKKKET